MVLHLDMDYFFAQVEERENPRFKGVPLVVGADPKKGKGRGVVSTCNYEARKFGIHSGMAISKAYEACPEAIYLPVNMELYSRVSENIFRIIEKVSEKYEKVSLDEAYIDLSGLAENYKQAERIGCDLKKLIFKKEKLTCSVGIGENKMIAKIASEEDKPDGLKVVKAGDALKFISQKSIREIPGIGPKTEKKLGIILGKSGLKIKDLRAISKKQLVDVLGKRGEEIYKNVRGEDDSEIDLKTKTKSIGKEITFDQDTLDPEKIISTFKNLSQRVAGMAKTEERPIKTVVVTCRFENFNTYSRQVSFKPRKPTKGLIYKKGAKLLLKLLAKKLKPVRLLGIRVIFDESDKE